MADMAQMNDLPVSLTPVPLRSEFVQAALAQSPGPGAMKKSYGDMVANAVRVFCPPGQWIRAVLAIIFEVFKAPPMAPCYPFMPNSCLAVCENPSGHISSGNARNPQAAESF